MRKQLFVNTQECVHAEHSVNRTCKSTTGKSFETLSCCAFPLVASCQLNQIVAAGIHVPIKKLDKLGVLLPLSCALSYQNRTHKRGLIGSAFFSLFAIDINSVSISCIQYVVLKICAFACIFIYIGFNLLFRFSYAAYFLIVQFTVSCYSN